MLREVTSFLFDQGKLRQQTQQNFLLQNHHCSPRQMVQVIYNMDPTIIERMMDIPNMKRLLFSMAQHADIKEPLVSRLYGDEIPPEQQDGLEQLIRNHGSDFRSIFNRLNEQEDLGSQDEIEGYVNECQWSLMEKIKSKLELSNIDLRPTIEKEQLVTEREQLVTEREQLATEREQLATEREQLAMEREEIKEDIQQIPKPLDLYKLMKMEIGQIDRILEGKEPQLTNAEKDYLNSLQVAHPEARVAKNHLIQGTYILNNLKVFRRNFCGLDIFKIKRILNEGRRIQEQTLQMIRNQKKMKVIFLIGLTGSGKTTMISKMVGIQLHKIEVSGMYTVQPVNIQQVPLQYRHLVIGSSNASMTRYPRIYKIPKQYLTEDDQDNYDAVYAMDSAGFFDTNGPQVEIANRISIMDILGCVDDVQIAILMNQRSWGAKGQGFKGLLQTILSLIEKDKLKQIKKSISIIFNQYDDTDQRRSLHQNIRDLERNLQNGTFIFDSNAQCLFNLFRASARDPNNMFRFNPLEDSPQQLMRKLTQYKQPTNVMRALSRSIGNNLKQLIRDNCAKFGCQFQYYFQQGLLQQAQFFLKMLRYVDQERKMDAQSRQMMTKMNQEIEKKLKEQGRKFQRNLQQYSITNWESLGTRDRRLQQLKSQYKKLQEEISKFLYIGGDSEANKLSEELENKMKDFMEKYKERMNDSWNNQMKNSQGIVQKLKNGIALFENFFPDQKQSILKSLRQQQSTLKSEIPKEIRTFNKEHSVTKKWRQYQAICQILDSDVDLDYFRQEFQDTYKSLRSSSLITDIDEGTKIIRLLLTNKANKIQQTQEFLSFIELIPSYPKKITSNHLDKAKKDYTYLTSEVPKALHERFERIVRKNSDFEDEEGQSEEMDGAKNFQDIKQIIQSLKILESISYVRMVSTKKIETQYQNLINVIEKEFKMLESLKDAFIQRDYNKINEKKAMCKKWFNKLRNLVRITEDQQIKTRFQELKEQFGRLIFSFTDRFNQNQAITLSSTQSLQKKNEDWNIIKLFEFVYEMLGQNQELFRNMENQRSKIVNKIRQPLIKYLQELREGRLIIQKLSKFDLYISSIDPQLIHYSSKSIQQIQEKEEMEEKPEPSIQQIQESIKEEIQNLKSKMIKNPLDELMNELQSLGIEDSSIERMYAYFQKANIQTLRRAYKLVAQIKNYENIQGFVEDIMNYKQQIFDKFEYFINAMEIRIESPMSINLIHQLRALLNKLQNIQDSINQNRGIFSSLINKVAQQIMRMGQNTQMIIDKIRFHKDEQVNRQQIVNAYRQLRDNKSEVGRQNLQILIEFLERYGRNSERKLQDIRRNLIIEESQGEPIFQFLETIKKHREDQAYITNSIRDSPNLLIPNIGDHLSYIQQKIMGYYQTLYEEIMEIRDRRKLEQFAQIENLKKDIQATHNYEFPLIANQLEKQKKAALVEILTKKFKILRQRKRALLQSQSFDLQSIQQDFRDVFGLSVDHEKDYLSEKVKQAVQTEIKDLQQKIRTIHHSEYEDKIKMIRYSLIHLPRELQVQQRNLLDKAISDRQNYHKKKLMDIKGNISNMNDILNYANQIRNQGDTEKLKQLERTLFEKYMEVPDVSSKECFEILKDLDACKSKIQIQQQRIKKLFWDYEIRVLKKIKEHLKLIIKWVLKQYQQDNGREADSISSYQLTEKSYQKKKKLRISYFQYLNQAMSVFRVWNYRAPEQCEQYEQQERNSALYQYIQIQINIQQQIRQQIGKILHDFKQKFEIIAKETHDNWEKIINNPRDNIQQHENTFKNIHLYRTILQKIGFLGIQAQQDIQWVLQSFYGVQEQVKFYQPLNLYSLISQMVDQEEITSKLRRYQRKRSDLTLLSGYFSDYYTLQVLSNELTKEISNDCENCKKDSQQTLKNEEFFDDRINRMLKVLKQIQDGFEHFIELRECNIAFANLRDYFENIIEEQNRSCTEQIERLNQIEEAIRNKCENLKNEQQQKINALVEARKRPNSNKIQNIEQETKAIRENYRQKIGEARNQNKHEKQNILNQFKYSLFKLQKIAALEIFSEKYSPMVEGHIKRISSCTAYHDFQGLVKLSKSPLGFKIQESLSTFGISALSNPITKQQMISQGDILRQMEKDRTITDNQKDEITKYCSKFIGKYSQLINEIKIQNRAQSIDKIQSSFQSFKEQPNIIDPVQSFKEQPNIIDPEQRMILLAKIFFLWQITQEIKNSVKPSDEIKCRATPTQIICCLLLIGIDCDDDKAIVNRLAEVSAGQGKTTMIGILGVYFAILGYEVHCLCEQQFLCEKNRKIFEGLFSMCKVRQKIKYGTCQDLLNMNLRTQDGSSEKLTYKECIEKILKSSNISDPKHEKDILKVGEMISMNNPRKKILLIDEISSLFDPKYYGKALKQTVTLRDKTIQNMFLYIWRNKNIDVNKLKNSRQFKEVVSRYPILQKMLQNQLYGILQAFQTYKAYHYKVQNKKIVYKDKDTYSSRSYGYNTVFAYLEENQKNPKGINIQGNIGIPLCVGEFSYSCLLDFYPNLLGMATIIRKLPQEMRQQLMKRCNIAKSNIISIPLAYKRSGQRIDEKTIEMLKQPLKQTIIKSFSQEYQSGRPIILIFKNKKNISQFYKSQEFQRFNNHAICITDDRKMKIWDDIKQSGFQQKITLIEETILKGTDFRPQDQTIEKGFHIVATYFLESPTLYAQAQGKVTRNGHKGSIVEIIRNKEEERGNSFKLYKKNDQQCIQAHNAMVSLFNGQRVSIDRLIDYIEKKNGYPQYSQQTRKYRIPLLIDGTHSMGLFLEKFRFILPNIFKKVLNSQKDILLQIKIIVFRNYNSPYHQLVQSTGFQINPHQLNQFLQGLQPNKGWGNEAVEVGLQVVNSLKKVDKVFIFSDARGNPNQEVEMKRKHYNNLEQERKGMGMNQTTTENQVKSLIKKGVKVYGFYLQDSQEISQYYNKIAQQTGGKSQYIDIYDEKAAEKIQEQMRKIIQGMPKS